MKLTTRGAKILPHASLSSSELQTVQSVLRNPLLGGAKDELAGHWSLVIDPANRLQIPAPTLNYFKKCGTYVVFSPAGEISLITKEDFACLKEALIKLTPDSSEGRAKLARWLTISARQLRIDNAGRVAIPKEVISLLCPGIPTDKKCRKDVLIVARDGRLVFEEAKVQANKIKFNRTTGLQNLKAPSTCKHPRVRRGGSEAVPSRKTQPIPSI